MRKELAEKREQLEAREGALKHEQQNAEAHKMQLEQAVAVCRTHRHRELSFIPPFPHPSLSILYIASPGGNEYEFCQFPGEIRMPL